MDNKFLIQKLKALQFNNYQIHMIVKAISNSDNPLTVTVNGISADVNGNINLVLVKATDDFADDAAAAVGGIEIGGLYHTAGVVKLRLV